MKYTIEGFSQIRANELNRRYKTSLVCDTASDDGETDGETDGGDADEA